MSNILVKIPGIEGEATLPGYEGQIQCQAMQHGIDLPVVSQGAARTEGASIHASIMLVHEIDKSTPLLRLQTAQTTNLASVVITRMRMVGQEPKPAEIITLGTAELVSVYLETPLGQDGRPADMPVEVFVIDYEEIKWEYKYYVGGVEDSTVAGSYSTHTLSTAVSI